MTRWLIVGVADDAAAEDMLTSLPFYEGVESVQALPDGLRPAPIIDRRGPG